jgi:gamma-glutamyltranspeptidase/glutathione hydrolase
MSVSKPEHERLGQFVNPGPRVPQTGLKSAVTTDNAIVTATMVKVLREGGNAADAAIAGAMVQAAVEPFMTNHAGLVTFLYYEAKTGKIHQLDSLGGMPSGLPPFRPVPQGAGPYANLPPSGNIPGFMPGLKALHEKFGTMPWHRLCEDAVAWAEHGHPVSSFEYGVNVWAEKFITYFPEGREFFQPDGYFASVGDRFVPKGLADTLKQVAVEGPDYMIRGGWGKKFVEKANEMGWAISLQHMDETPPRWLEPIRFTHHEHEVVSLGPPQAQGIFLAIVMGVLKHLGIRDMVHGSADHLWAMAHALRLGTRHWEFAQDEQVYGVPKDELLDDSYHSHLARLLWGSRPKLDLTEHVRLTGATPGLNELMKAMGGFGKPRTVPTANDQPSGSCEIACVDEEGNWIQFMDTLQGSGLPGMVIDGVSMMGCNATFGALTSPLDATLVPGAKLRCIIGNTFVLKDNLPVFSAGSPGSVFCTVPQVISNFLDFGMDPYAAVDAPRLYPISEDRGIVVEDRISEQTIRDLYRLGVRVGVLPKYDYHMGSFSVIAREPNGRFTAIADPRRTAVADGIR